MVDMLLAAERARFVEGDLCIQGFVANIVGGNAPIIEYSKIRISSASKGFEADGFLSRI